MTKQQAENLKAICDASHISCEIYEGYCPGRGETTAIVVERVLEILCAVMNQDCKVPRITINHLRQDSLGKKVVIY